MSDKNLQIVFITNAQVPHGTAVTNRLLSLAKGIVSNGSIAKIIIINPTEHINNVCNIQPHGVIDGVEYTYLSRDTIWPRSKIMIGLTYIVGVFRLVFTVLSYNKKEIDAIIFMNIPSIYILSIFPLTKAKGIILLQERNEFPYVQKSRGLLRKFDDFINRKVTLKVFNGMILITKELVLYFRKYVRKSCVLMHVQMTVDEERFKDISPSPIKSEYVAYTGYMWGTKDGLPGLIHAFSYVIRKYPNLILCLIGDTSNYIEFLKLKDLTKTFDLQNNVLFTGYVDRDDIPSYLLNAKLLLLDRPNNEQAKGGFPTKLGEYLASGVPVVVSNVGEISDYLTDGENAFLAEPDNPLMFASKILEALENYEGAKKIGSRGKLVAQDIFSYKVQGSKIIEMIQSIKTSKVV